MVHAVVVLFSLLCTTAVAQDSIDPLTFQAVWGSESVVDAYDTVGAAAAGTLPTCHVVEVKPVYIGHACPKSLWPCTATEVYNYAGEYFKPADYTCDPFLVSYCGPIELKPAPGEINTFLTIDGNGNTDFWIVLAPNTAAQVGSNALVSFAINMKDVNTANSQMIVEDDKTPKNYDWDDKKGDGEWRFSVGYPHTDGGVVGHIRLNPCSSITVRPYFRNSTTFHHLTVLTGGAPRNLAPSKSFRFTALNPPDWGPACVTLVQATACPEQPPMTMTVPPDVYGCDTRNYGVPTVSDTCRAHTLRHTDCTLRRGCNTTIIRTWTATDHCGTSIAAKQLIAVANDGQPPTFSNRRNPEYCPPQSGPECIPMAKLQRDSFAISDNCDKSVSVSLQSCVTSAQGQPFECTIDTANSRVCFGDKGNVKLDGRKYELTWEAEDNCGYTTQYSNEVTFSCATY